MSFAEPASQQVICIISGHQQIK